MTLRFVIESTPHPQPSNERAYHGGTFVIGRSDKADWRLHDPESYVSRKHCIVSESDSQIIVTDASTHGLFIDGGSEPLGPGRSVALEDGMRLRMGDIVVRVDMRDGRKSDDPRAEAERGDGLFVFSFNPSSEPAPLVARPVNKPDSIYRPPGRSAEHHRSGEPADLKPVDWKNPFELDLRRADEAPGQEEVPPVREVPARRREEAGMKYFQTETAPERQPPEVDGRLPEAPELTRSYRRPVEPLPLSEPAREAPAQEDLTCRDVHSRGDVADGHARFSPAGSDDAGVWEAFCRGLGLPPEGASAPPEDVAGTMESLGRQYRTLLGGLVQLLLIRAEEKQNFRIATTRVGSRDVNPLKFVATTDSALQAMLRPPEPGYLGAEDAVGQAVHDLADHQVRTWRALQTALHRIIDRFDPSAIEAELAEAGLIERLISGGRSAKLWQAYQERYREIARSAEKRFLGEVGADFRDAYEQKAYGRKGGQRDGD